MKRDNEQQKEGLFFKVSIENIQNGFISKIGLREFAVLSAIASFANNKGECFPSQDKLAEICGVDRKTINRIVKKLCEYRTEDGKPVLVKNTERKGMTKTQTDYKILSSAGMAFGSNMVVPKLGQRKEDGDNVKDSKEVVPKLSYTLYQNCPEGSTKNGTLTKTIERNPINESQKEQEPIKGGASFVDKEKDSLLKDNNKVQDNNSFVAKVKDSKELAKDTNYNQSYIVAKESENKSDIPENKEGTARGGAVTASQDSERAAVLAMIEANRKAREAAEAKANEERRKKAAELSQAIRYKIAKNGKKNGHIAAETDSKGKSLSVQQKPKKGQNDTFDALSFDAILAMSDEEIRAMIAK